MKWLCKIFGHGRLYICLDWMMPEYHLNAKWDEHVNIQVKCVRCGEIPKYGGSYLQRIQYRRK